MVLGRTVPYPHSCTFSLAVALRRNADVRGEMVGREPHKLALCADNLLMYVSSPTITQPIILKEFFFFTIKEFYWHTRIMSTSNRI